MIPQHFPDPDQQVLLIHQHFLNLRSTESRASEPCLTCAFLQVAGSFPVHPQLTVEIFLPELREPNVPPVVGQRAALEIPIERCRGGGGKPTQK